MAQLFYEPLARVFTNTGAVGAGYKYYFYTTGTTTPISSYTTQALSVANAYPVVSDSNGRFPPIWLSNLNTTKVVLTDSVGNVIETQDPIGATSSTTSLNDLDVRPTSYWGLTTGTSTAYTLTANPSISAYSNVQTFFFQAHIANDASATIAINGLSALNLKKYTGQGTKVALQVGDLQATERYEAICDGVDIVVLNPRNKNTYYGTNQPLTIATGVIIITNGGSIYAVDTEGSAATDDLDTINGGNQGQFIILGNTNAARSVVLKHNTGNIFNPGGINITLSATTDRVTLTYDSTLAKWIVIGVNSVGATPVQLVATKTASSSASLQFTTGLSSTFSYYEFEFINILPANNAVMLTMQYSVDGGSTWINTNYLQRSSWASTSDSEASVTNKTTGISITGSDANAATCPGNNATRGGVNGYLRLYNPANASAYKQALWFVTYPFTTASNYQGQAEGVGIYTGATSAINAVQFIFKTANTDTNNGNIASGSIKMYGVV
jgi:hypothetical protein